MSRTVFICHILTAVALSISTLLSAQGHRGIGEPALDRKLMELPAIRSTDVVLVYNGFVVSYNTQRLIPDWVAYELTVEEAAGSIPRARGFGMDLDYKGRQAMREDYSNTGWDKGHMAPSADMKWSQTAMNESFYLTNICPQDPKLNGRDWHSLEKYVRDWAVRFGSVWVVCGPIVHDNQYGVIGEGQVVVPDGFFKAVLRRDGREFRSIAFVFENNSERQPVKNAVVSVNDVEALIGFDLFPNLRDRIEERVESQADWDEWIR
jgi:DNA/RNA endonuclease G, NUC1